MNDADLKMWHKPCPGYTLSACALVQGTEPPRSRPLKAGSGSVGSGLGGLGVFFTGYEGAIAMPHWPSGAASRLRAINM